jgi:hypothetical protein
MTDEWEDKDLLSLIKTVLKKYASYMDDKVTGDFGEVYNNILLPALRKLTTNSQFKNDLGESNMESLNLLLINIKEKFDVYNHNDEIGNDDEARKEKKEAMFIASKIITKLENLLESLSVKGADTDDNINKKSDPKSKSIVEELTLDENDWSRLIDNIKVQQCVPFVGSDIWNPEGPLSHIAEEWTNLYDYPFEDSSQLSRVAQFLAIDKGDPMYPKKMLSKMLREIKPPDFKKVNNSPYLTLASLNLPIYITTNYDHILEEALKSQNKKPTSEVCRWFDDLKIYLDRAGKSSVFKGKSKYTPTSQEPLVYHLHGDMYIPQSMVLTERDYIQFVINLSKEKEKYIFPTIILQRLATSSLLFIGYSLEEINFRIIFQCVLGLQVGDLRESSLSVQLPPRLSENKHKKALKYLREYIQDQQVYVYWGDSNSFCNDLSKRLG